jgi:uncharacterized protein (UPF0333 family)
MSRFLKEQKAQGSFELIIIILGIFVVTMLVLSNYLEISDSTTGMAILKTAAIEELSKEKQAAYIQEIEYADCTNSIKFNVITFPATISVGTTEIDEIKSQIDYHTKWDFTEIDISFNGASPSC